VTGPLPFSDQDDDRPPQAARLGPKLRALAAEGVYFGTSSWKYEGWLGSIYRKDLYTTRGKFSQKKFEAECLAEYAETFPTVCGDFAFYQFPSPDYWKRLFEGTPTSLLFGFKVPEDITVARWPKHARYGTCAGKDNDHFLDVNLFRTLFTRLLAPYADRVGPLIFEFGTFPKATFADRGAFLERLDPFLAALPEGFRYAVEIRNPEYLGGEYLAALAGRNVAHVLNAWTRMPELARQVETPGVFTADFTVVRALLSRGRSYEQAVASFEPYELIKEPNEPARESMRQVAEQARQQRKPAFLFVNNRLEGHAPTTIEAVADRLAP
jgi:uncharacterized protein YecE (DUF72 family)